MRSLSRSKTILISLGVLVAGGVSAAVTPQYPAYPSETPEHFQVVTSSFDFDRREVMIPMRDGVKLHTVILVPKGSYHAPMLLTRTPYNATELTTYGNSSHLGPNLNGYDNALPVIIEGGYIRVVQDIRGKYGSEGDYVMNRPLHGPQNPTPVDDSTDCYDTIAWLIKNVPESNAKVGILGISYDGFEPLMALVNPHPALKVSVPMNPMVDGWMGDDWFHNGAFRQQNIPYIHDQTATRDNSIKWWNSHFDDYDQYMSAGSAGELAHRHGLEQIGFWNKVTSHPSYDAFWSDQALDKILAKEPLTVPVMLVHSLLDQEDIYGAPAVYRTIKPKDTRNDKVFLVMGPWHHGQEIEDGSHLGPIRFGQDTSLYFQREILRPFLDHFLKDNAPALTVAPVTAFETGTNTWRRLSFWPSGCEQGCAPKITRMYLQSDSHLTFDVKVLSAQPSYDEYVSDPAKPVPFRSRPIQPVGYTNGLTWSQWLVDDQREASGRTDVLTYMSDTLTAPLKISGNPSVNLSAATTGSDADWVVKLIDVYPAEVASQPELGGYQLMISADILRGRYREGFDKAKPITPNEVLTYRFELPMANHVFLPGHRLMVQVQSSWFPLYDRNPQKFVDNIFFAKPGDYQKATQRIYHDAAKPSYIELPVGN
jgi:uncharacterized protein